MKAATILKAIEACAAAAQLLPNTTINDFARITVDVQWAGLILKQELLNEFPEIKLEVPDAAPGSNTAPQ